MKNKYIIPSLFITLLLGGCDKNDLFDKVATIGKQAPQVYWELTSSTANAGDSVFFRAQYYSVDIPVDYSQVWYNVMENITIGATCPLVTTFKYNVSYSTSEEVRQFSPVITYPHSESYWSSERKAYMIEHKFPTSSTLTAYDWKNVGTFDPEIYNKLFPDTFATSFRQNLYKQMQVDDFRKVFVTVYEMEETEFIQFVDSVYNDNSAGYDYFIKPDLVASVKNKFDEIPFEDLLYNTTDKVYQIEYSKEYELKGRFQAIDKNGVIGVSETKTINLQ